MDSERISLEDQRSYDDLFRKKLLPDGFGGLKRLKSLRISSCKTEECLANAPATTIVFPVLEELDFSSLRNLRQICRGPVPEGSFGKLTSIEIRDCYNLEYLFPLQIVGCLTQLKRLTIQYCLDMKEVIWKEQGDTHIATNGIEFPNLEFLHLVDLPNLVGFCTGIDQIDFPKLRCMHLESFSKRLFAIKSSLSSISEKNFDVGKQILHSPNASSIFPLFDIKGSLSSISEKNFDVGKQILDISNASSIFPQKVTFPCLEDLSLEWLRCKGYSDLQFSSFLTVKKLVVNFCSSLRYVFNSSMARHLVHLKELNISNCSEMYAVVDWEEEIEDGQERKEDTTLFPQLSKLQLNDLSNLRRLCRSPVPGGSFGELTSVEISDCNSLEYLFPLQIVGCLTQLERLTIQKCAKMDAVVGWEEEIEDGQERKVDTTLFPQLSKLQLNDLSNLKRFCHFTHTLELPMLSELDIQRCPIMEEFSLGHVSTPNLSSPGISWNGDLNPDISWNGDLNNAIRLLQKMNSTISWRETLPPNPQRGRCICFRTADLYTDTSVITRFYSVPFDLFGDGGDDDASSSNPDVEGLEPFYKCTDFATTSTLSSVGSSLFVVGGSKETGPCRVSITTEKMYRFDTAAPKNDWYKWVELSMQTPRAFPITVAMDGKLYIFGGSDPESPDAPLAELFDPESSTSVPLPLPSGFPINAWCHLVVAALQPSKKILVASGLSSDAYEYNVGDQGWEKLDYKVDFSSVQGQAAVVQNGNALCWCSNNVDEVHAYHLVHKRWFKSPIKGLDKAGMRDPDGLAHYCPIFPLDDNHLCLLWKDHMGYDGTNLPLLHCVKIQVSIDPERYRFDAVVVASRTYALGPDESIFDAHVFLREDDEGGERGSGRGGLENGGRTWERSGYGGGKRTVSSIAPFKTCSKCWGTGHTESSCDQVGSGAGT